MIETDPAPSIRRIVAAFILAPWAPSLAVVAVFPYFGASEEILHSAVMRLIYGLLLGYLLTLVLGLPAFILLHRRVRLTALRCTVLGATVTGLPAVLFSAFAAYFVWEIIVALAVLGALGGVMFWVAAAARLTLSQSDAE